MLDYRNKMKIYHELKANYKDVLNHSKDEIGNSNYYIDKKIFKDFIYLNF